MKAAFSGADYGVSEMQIYDKRRPSVVIFFDTALCQSTRLASPLHALFSVLRYGCEAEKRGSGLNQGSFPVKSQWFSVWKRACYQ